MGRPLDEDMVINIIKNGDYYMTWIDRAMLIEEIKDLPSAQSEHEIEQCCNNCKWYRSMDDYCVNYSCNIDGREKHSCFEEK